MQPFSLSHRSTLLLTIAFIIHNVEEAVFICRYPVENLVSFIKPLSCGQFKVAVSIITVVVLSFVIIAMQTKNRDLYLFISSSISAALVLNAVVPHIVIAIYTLHYTPGLVSAVLLIVPSGLWVIGINNRIYANRKKMLKHIGSGLAIGYLIFIVTAVLVKIFI
ncbi:MAG: HXXEE domain-containing protein [Bacteroidales bacterium]